MQVTLTSDVEGKKSGETATVTAERGAWLRANGYAIVGDVGDVILDYKSDPTLASNREDADADLPKVDRADNASEVHPEISAFPADIDPEPKGDAAKEEAPEVAYELGERRPALITPAPTTDRPEPRAVGTDWAPDDVVPDTTNDWTEPDISMPEPDTGTGAPVTLTREQAGSHENSSASAEDEGGEESPS